jgi:tetratricopeptide (TPR) repeat protein
MPIETPSVQPEPHRRLAAALELQGRWQEALASREQAAVAFTTAGLPADAAAERLASAAHLRSAGSFRAALSLLEIAGDQARQAGRVDLQARILGQEGNVRARMGEGRPAVELVRAGPAMALEHGLTGPAADIYQPLADALEHAGDYSAAKETYDETFSFCASNALEPTTQLCLARLTAVLRQSGDWDRELRSVVRSSLPPTRRCTLVPLPPECSARSSACAVRQSGLGHYYTKRSPWRAGSNWQRWSCCRHGGWPSSTRLKGATESAAGHFWPILERWKQTEDRHYVISLLRWATTFFAESGDAAGARSCAAALARVAEDVGHNEAMSALSHALGETALLDGAAEQAAGHFGWTLIPPRRGCSDRSCGVLAPRGCRVDLARSARGGYRAVDLRSPHAPAARCSAFGGTRQCEPCRAGRTSRAAA